MKHLLAFLLFVSLSPAAHAEWSVYAEAVEKGKPFTVYIDKDTIKYNGKHSAEIWTMFDFPKGRMGIVIGDTTPFTLVKLEKYYCSTRLIEDVYTETFSGSMGRGETIIKLSSPTAPVPIVPNSKEDSTLKLLCK